LGKGARTDRCLTESGWGVTDSGWPDDGSDRKVHVGSRRERSDGQGFERKAAALEFRTEKLWGGRNARERV
jgi:hypothetical protein